MDKMSIPDAYRRYRHKFGSKLEFLEFVKENPINLKASSNGKIVNCPKKKLSTAFSSLKSQEKFLKYLSLELNDQWGGDEFRIGPYSASIFFYDSNELAGYFDLHDFYRIESNEGTKISDYIKDVGNSGFKVFEVYLVDEIMMKVYTFRSLAKAKMLKFLVEQFDENPEASFEITSLLSRFGIERRFEKDSKRIPQIRDLLDNDDLAKYFMQRDKSVFFSHPSSWVK